MAWELENTAERLPCWLVGWMVGRAVQQEEGLRRWKKEGKRADVGGIYRCLSLH